jgi:hypothetical protein
LKSKAFLYLLTRGSWILLFWMVFLPALVDAQTEDKASIGMSGGVTVSGILDFYYSHNFTNYNLDHPGAGNALHGFDSADNAFALGLAEVGLRAPEGDTAARLDLGFGPVADRISSGADKNILRAYATYQKDPWFLEAGKFDHLMGFEEMESPVNWNYSRSFLFTYAYPLYTLGFWGRYSFGPDLQASAYVSDGWNSTGVGTFYDKTWGGRLVFTPGNRWTLTFNGLYGTLTPPLSRRALEALLVWNGAGTFSAALDSTWGQDDDFLPGGPGRVWSGLALYGRYQLSPDWVLAARVEDLVDHDGAITGWAGDFREGTLTVEHPLSSHWLTRLEGRYDWALDPSGGAQGIVIFNGSANQATLSVSSVYRF